MFWDTMPKELALGLGVMTKTLSEDFTDLSRTTTSKRLPEVWHGVSIESTPSGIAAKHPRFPDFFFEFIADPDAESKIRCLRITGLDDYSGVNIHAKWSKIVAQWQPESQELKISRKARRLLETLEKECNIRHLPIAQKQKKDASLGPTIAAAMTASIIMALSDGEFTFEKRDRLVGILSVYKKGYLSAQEVLSMMETHVTETSEIGESAWPSVMNTMSKKLSVSSKRIILHAAGTMALVDGVFSQKEQTKIAELAQWIELEKPDFRDWIKEFTITVDLAEIMDLTVA